MALPPLLAPNDTVGIIAPSRLILPNQLESALEVFKSWGLDVRQGHSLYASHGYFAGSDTQRLADLQGFINDSSIKAIFCARGGYGMTRIIDQVDLNPLHENPKWIIGFSDITALHLKLSKNKLSSVHGLMPVQFEYFDAQGSIQSLKNLLFEGRGKVEAPPHEFNRPGQCQAEMIGGNLSLIADSLGTNTEIDPAGKVLFIEEIDEYLYKIDRMLVQLKRAGKFDRLAGVLIGDFSQMKDTQIPFGQSLEEIIINKFREYDYPVGFGFAIGHEIPNYSIPFTSPVQFEVGAEQSLITF